MVVAHVDHAALAVVDHAALAVVAHAAHAAHAALVVAQIQRCLKPAAVKKVLVVKRQKIHLVLYPVPDLVAQRVDLAVQGVDLAAQVEKDQTHFVQLVLNLHHCA